jgi:adenylate cyclase
MTIQAWGRYLQKMRKSVQHSLVNKNLLFSGFLSGVFAIGLWQVGAWTPLELAGFNLLFRSRNSLTHPSWDERIVIIGIDDYTLSQYGQFPLSRDRYTQFLESLEASPPATIGFDILFIEPSSHDTTLAEAMAINGQVVLAVAPSLQKQTLRPVPILDRVTTKGHIVSNADVDGVTRQLSLYINQVPAFSIKLLEAYNRSLQETFGVDTTNLGKSVIPIPPMQSEAKSQSAWINWIAPTQHISSYSFADVLQGKIDTAKLKNKILLVGLTATGTNDPSKTPFQHTPPTSGIYIHAAAIDNLLNHRFLHKLPWQLELLLLLTIGTAGTFILGHLKFYHRILVLGLLPFTWFGLSLLAVTASNLWLPIAAPIGTIFLAGISLQWQEQQEKQQLMSLFARHVSQETATLIWQHREEIFQNGQLDAKEMVATVLFSDIRRFTTISEEMEPRDLLNWLNSYLGAMAECVENHHGVVDKYIGDAVMAVFGIPFPHTQTEKIQADAINAVYAAISMQERLIALNQEFENLDKPTIEIGIGIHTGLLVAGSIGGYQRLNYSVLGDAVNIAARLEQLNKSTQKENPYQILVSETTFHLIKQHFSTQKVQQLYLRGKQELTMVYAITGKK